MNTNASNIHCKECDHCFKSNRSKTGYKCAVWGYDDFASDTVLEGFCHKAKPKINLPKHSGPVPRYGG